MALVEGFIPRDFCQEHLNLIVYIKILLQLYLQKMAPDFLTSLLCIMLKVNIFSPQALVRLQSELMEDYIDLTQGELFLKILEM